MLRAALELSRRRVTGIQRNQTVVLVLVLGLSFQNFVRQQVEVVTEAQLVASAARLRDCASRESVPGQTCRTPRGSSRGRDSPRSLDIDNPAARQHHGIGTADTSMPAAKSCCTGHHRRAATSACRRFASSTTKMHSSAAQSASITPAASCTSTRTVACAIGSAPSRAATALEVCDVETSRTSSAGPNARSTSPWRSVFVQHGRPAECRWRRACRKHIKR